MPTVLHITDKPSPGGGIRRVVDSQRELAAEQGWETRLLRLVPRGGSVDASAVADRTAATPRRFGVPPAIRALEAMGRDGDLIHLHLGFTAISQPFFDAAHRLAPLVVSLHDISPFRDLPAAGDPFQGFAPVEPPLERFKRLVLTPSRRGLWKAICHSGCIIHAPSCYLADLAIGFGAPPPSVQIIRPALGPAPSKTDPPSDCPATVLYVGQLSRNKGAAILLDAFAKLDSPGSRLVYVGDGPIRKALEDRTHAMGLSARVAFRGSLNPKGVMAEMNRARVVAHPSLIPEGFGLTGLEALQCGRPVLGFAKGGSADWLIHDRTGLIAEPTDPAALTRGLDCILSDGALADRLGRAGQELAARLSGRETVAKALLTSYRSAIDPQALVAE